MPQAIDVGAIPGGSLQSALTTLSAAGAIGPPILDSGWDNIDPLIEHMFAVSIEGAPVFDALDGYVASVQFGLPAVDTRPVKQRGMIRYYAWQATIPQLGVTFNEDTQGTILNWYRQIQRTAYDDTNGTVGLPSDYDMDITASILAPDGTPVVSVKFLNCVAISCTSYSMSTAGANALRPQIGFRPNGVRTNASSALGPGLASLLPSL